MVDLLPYVLFAFAVNADSFVAGFAYGGRNIRIPALSLLIISLISVAAICASMLAGNLLTGFIPEHFARRLGGLLLLLLGLWILLQGRRQSRNGNGNGNGNSEAPAKPEEGPARLINIRIQPLGLVIQVLREPARADLDSSGTISSREALILGTALAMDAFCAGFAVSMLGFSIGITALVVGLGHFLMLYLGMACGHTLTHTRLGRYFTVLPGIILIVLGTIKIN